MYERKGLAWGCLGRKREKGLLDFPARCFHPLSNLETGKSLELGEEVAPLEGWESKMSCFHGWRCCSLTGLKTTGVTDIVQVHVAL